jgi:outer membrane protein TolC
VTAEVRAAFFDYFYYDRAIQTTQRNKELLEKLMEKVEELNQPGVDEKEALAKLSEMQAEVQALANQLSIAAMDGQLSSLGTALAASWEPSLTGLAPRVRQTLEARSITRNH